MSAEQQLTTSYEGWKLLFLVAFIEGAIVMAVELLCARMITPYFGATVPVWSSVLGVTMLGLSCGYYVGGILSKKWGQETLYYLMFAIAGITCLLPVFSSLIMDQLLDIDDFRVAAVYAALLFIFPIMLLFGTIPPQVIFRLSHSTEESGNKTGSVYAVSTAGGVIMTLIVGFYLLPTHGIRITASLSGILIAIPSLIYFAINKKPLLATFGVLGYVLLAAVSFKQARPNVTSKEFSEVYSTNTLQGNMKVVDYKAKETRALYNNNISQSYIHIPTGRSQWTYVHRLGTYTSFLPQGSEVFLVGLGGGNVVTEFKILGFQVDVCDIEPRTVEIAKNYFGMPEPRSIIIDDARHAINNAEGKYDLVVLDVSAGETQPSNLYTLEGFEAIKRMLKESGYVFIHYPTVMGGDEVIALKSICKTMNAVGFKTNLINTGNFPEHIREQFVVASLNDFDLEKENFNRRDLFAEPFGFPTSGDFMIEDFDVSEGIILTDDRPIMDELHYGISERHRKDGINVTVKGMLNNGMKMY